MECAKESVLVSAVRSFFRAFFTLTGLFLAFLICGYLYSMLSVSPLLEDNTTLKVLPDAEGNRKIVPMHTPAILQINIHGVIGDPKGVDSKSIENILLDSRDGMLEGDRVKGILIHFNTPGGTVDDSDNIYRMLLDYKTKYKVPVFAYVDGLCASGGMYIASATDKIYASPSSVIGSVGVMMGPFFNVSDTLSKVGIQAKTLTEGLYKDMMNPTRPWKEGDDASIKTIMQYLYNRFVDIVVHARPIDRQKLISEYGAGVYDVVTAQSYGYIDVAKANRSDALAALLHEIGIDPSASYQVVELQPKTDILSQIFSAKSPLLSGKIEHSFDFGEPCIKDRFAYLYKPE